MYVENRGLGLNLSIQVLDGIMCHNGELLCNEYVPEFKTKEQFLEQYKLACKDYKAISLVRPMTLEGCVVKNSDIIGYIGCDIEEAILLGIVKWEDLPKEVIQILGSSNGQIINTIVTNIIDNSINKKCISMSKEVYQAISILKEFNYNHIYSKSMLEKEKYYYQEGMNKIYYYYLDAIKRNDKRNIIYRLFFNNQDESYLSGTSLKRMVIDFIAGMTDELFLKEIENCDFIVNNGKDSS